MYAKLAMSAIAALVLGVASATAEIKMNAGHVVGPDTPNGRSIEFFAQRVEELSDGEMVVEVFHSGQLGKDVAVQLENVIGGAQDFFIETMDYFKSWDDRFGVLNTPFVFRDADHYQAFLESDLFADMVATIEAEGMILLGKGKFNWKFNDFRGILATRPILEPSDLEGFKMRMFQAEMPIRSWGAFDTNIQVIPWVDVYAALATGIVEGLTLPSSSVYLAKHGEVAKHYTFTREYFQIVSPIVSAKTWERLNDEQKAIIEQAAFEAGELYAKLTMEGADNLVKKAEDEMGVTFYEPDMAPFQAHMETVYPEFEAEGLIPEGMVAQVRAIK